MKTALPPTPTEGLSYLDRCKLVKTIKPGDVWTHRKTGKRAEVLAVLGRDLELQHESGRISRKQDHYFAGDFEPMPPLHPCESAA